MSLNPTAISQATTPVPQVDGRSIGADGHFREQNLATPQWTAAGNFTTGAAAGSGGSLGVVVSANHDCNDQSGMFDLTTGHTGTATGTLLVCIFSTAFPTGHIPKVQVWIESGFPGTTTPAQTTTLIPDTVTATGFNINLLGTVLTIDSVYRIGYSVIS